MSATASTPADAANAVDDDATTRWTTAAAQSAGQWLQVDLGSTHTIRRVVLDTGRGSRRLPARLHARDEHRRLDLGRPGVGRRQRPADDRRLPGDERALRAGHADRLVG
jgi:hypothetical protein